jgi:hypothetical protein
VAGFLCFPLVPPVGNTGNFRQIIPLLLSTHLTQLNVNRHPAISHSMQHNIGGAFIVVK